MSANELGLCPSSDDWFIGLPEITENELRKNLEQFGAITESK